MSRAWRQKCLVELFEVVAGDLYAMMELDPGEIPIVSCRESNNGVAGFFDIPESNIFKRAITVACDGSWPLTAKFHPYRFGITDRVAVLVPRFQVRDTTLLYVTAMLNRMTWRYSYGRKCFQKKLAKVRISFPLTRSNGMDRVDEDAIEDIFPRDYEEFIPGKANNGPIHVPRIRWRRFALVEMFNLKRGDFHSLAALDSGSCMTVSRVTEDNGVVGFFEPPDGARVYPCGTITVSTVGGDAFVQLDSFIATDNVIVCTPKQPLRPTSLYFLAFVLNREKWRYSYGRQCYEAKLRQLTLDVPVTQNREVDEDTMQQIVEQTSYWPLIERRFKV